ncbi:MAG: zinc ribbon domain-containing protein [Burkholderiales bacterium]|nr:MAG: zinc ribbon domain-containing protein [Burkholderiales bacterium]
MPIYAYRCERCGHAKDVIQKFSDTPLSICPECGADAFRKQLTAPSFQLKGSGWYVTDFRDNGKKAAAPAPAAASETSSGGAADSAKPADAAKPAAAPAPAAGAPAASPPPAKPTSES